MRQSATPQRHAEPGCDSHRHAYNAAFEELGLTWHWDAATYSKLQAKAPGRDGVRSYLETEHAHLLRAYEADFLVNAIETAKERCHASTASHGVHGAVGRPGDSLSQLAA